MKNKYADVTGSVSGNAAQMEAILHTDGPAMVLAGPGSGKTFVIVQRLVNLIKNQNVDPSAILVITFTKAAAIEMQQRFMKITDSSYPEVCFGTFHSVFYQIIRRSDPNNKQLKIATESTKYKIIRDVLAQAKARNIIKCDEIISDLEVPKDILSEISRLKNTGLKPSEVSSGIPLKEHFEYIFNSYNKFLMEYGLIDFDDMILKCFELLQNNKDILEMWSDRFKYILIDEYQDINLMQYKIVRLLCRNNNLFVVGDDDQSIYGFRGSDPSIMQSFAKEFEYIKSDHNKSPLDKNTCLIPKIINLNINYRCGKSILDNALLLINENKIRYKKELTAADTNGPGAVYPRRYINKQKQIEAIITFLKSQAGNLHNIAFICRTNTETFSLAAALKSAGIPTNLDEYARNFTDSPAVKLCEDYLRFVYEGKKREYFYRIMNKPMRYISRECAPSEKVSEAVVRNYYKGNNDKLKIVDKLFRQFNILAHMRPALTIRFLRNEIGIDKLFPGEIDALNELTELAQSITDNKRLLSELEKLRSKALDNSEKTKPHSKGDCVKLLTMHGSKGLEFDIVWLPNLNEGIIPSRSSITSEQIEEERRMLYVGMTRAKKALVLSYLTGNEENPMLPSRFLRPIKHLWVDNKLNM